MESNDSSNDNEASTPDEATNEQEVNETAANGETSEAADVEASKEDPSAEPNANNTEGGEFQDCWDAAVPPSKSTESAATQDEEEKESLQPGDHVTRWEMLPIAWPIQVHGIVLNVHEGTVVLVDFGLSAAPADKSKGSSASSAPSTPSNNDNDTANNDNNNAEGGEGDENMPDEKPADEKKPAQPKAKQLEQAIRNFKIGGMKREKNRLNINVLTDPKDISKWKKVNYETSWFGGSSSKKEDTKKSASPSKAKNWINRMAKNVKERTGPGIANLRERMRRNSQLGPSSAAAAEETAAADDSTAPQDNDSTVASTTADESSETNTTNPEESADATPDLEPAASHESTMSTDLKSTDSLVSEGSATPDFAGRPMNPKMKELLQKKQEENPPKTMNPAMAKLLKKKEEESLYEKKKKESLAKLPKADPTKLVLARTHWLLEHGENVLPPYHAFSSNSECLAVFCKTGRWNTLQADVFLHSTAIGNAKTMGATTIAVAASAPLLAPAVAVAGIGAVAAPWLYLNKQKNKAVDSQQRLNDAFWAQAEPEVFVACIQAWSRDLLELDGPATTTEDETKEIAEEEKEKEEEGAKETAPVVQQI